MSLEVVESYAVNLLVGVSASGYRDRGFPAGGPADGTLALIAQSLAGVSGAVLEVSAPLELRAREAVVLGVATYGEVIHVAGHDLSGCARVALAAGETLRLDQPSWSARVYVGGAFGDVVVNRPVRSVDVLSLGISGEAVTAKLARVPRGEFGELRWVRREGFAGELDGGLVLGQGSRVGIRVDGGCEGLPGLGLSEASMPGVIQVTPDGTLLIHGMDGPTIGGYPKAGGVISADWDKVGQLRAGDRVEFTEVCLEEAEGLLRGLAEDRADWKEEIERALFSKGVSSGP